MLDTLYDFYQLYKDIEKATSTNPRIDQTVYSGINRTDSLLGDYYWKVDNGVSHSLSYSFPYSSGQPYWEASYPLAINLETATMGLSDSEIAMAENAMAQWASVANIVFTRVNDDDTSQGDLRITKLTEDAYELIKGAESIAFAVSPNPHDSLRNAIGDVWIKDGQESQSTHYALIHEIGHSLGLKHPFEGDVQLSVPSGMLDENYTSMAYLDGTEAFWYERSGTKFVANPIYDLSLGILDIAAAQYLYGKNTSFNSGNDTYKFSPETPFNFAIWDAGGNDVIDASGFTENSLIDLRPGSLSSLKFLNKGMDFVSDEQSHLLYTGRQNLGIAYECYIEDIISGSGDDQLFGNSVRNVITGGGGDDEINGGEDIDYAMYLETHDELSVTKIGSNWVVKHGKYQDTLTDVERIIVRDNQIALDLDSNAGQTAKILGAVFGADAVSNKEYVGIGLHYLDSGWSYEQLMALAIDAALGADASHEDVVNHLYTNVVGVAPTEAEAKPFIEMLDSDTFSKGSLGVLAAETTLNASNIDLLGLAATGLEYAPIG